MPFNASNQATKPTAWGYLLEIISKLVKIETDLPTSTEFIEAELKKMGINPLRWAIVGVEGNILTISLACENL